MKEPTREIRSFIREQERLGYSFELIRSAVHFVYRVTAPDGLPFAWCASHYPGDWRYLENMKRAFKRAERDRRVWGPTTGPEVERG